MSNQSTSTFTSVYGPVSSWRYGRSLGIDPIGCVSTCSFDCVYCQLGEIEHKTSDRSIYIPTEQILKHLQAYAPWDVDVITLSGSGEPTLALNLAEIITRVKELTHKPVVVLTNGTLLTNSEVRAALTLADIVSIKLDSVSPAQLRRINRPVREIKWDEIQVGLEQFRAEFTGKLGIQTMILSPWDAEAQAEYIRLMQTVTPSEIQLNTPTRPKPLKHELDGRENHSNTESRPYAVQKLKCVSADFLLAFASKIHNATGILVRCAS